MKESDILDDILNEQDHRREQLASLMCAASTGNCDQELALQMAKELLQDSIFKNAPNSKEGLSQNLDNQLVVPAVKHLFRVSRSLPAEYVHYCKLSPWTTAGGQSLACQLYRIYLLKVVLLLGFPEVPHKNEIHNSLPPRLKGHPLVQKIETLLN